MLSDPITLYKLMILYMLAHVNFPLTNSQLTDFFLDHEYTTYFTLQQALNELREAGLLKMESIHNFYKSTNQDYIVHCEVREGKSALISLDVSVPDKDQAEIMCGHWKERSQEIYSFVMRSLMRSE